MFTSGCFSHSVSGDRSMRSSDSRKRTPTPAVERRRPLRLRLEFLEDRCLLSSAAAAYGQLPLAFEPNVGQTNSAIAYLARGPGYSVGLSAGGAFLALQGSSSSSDGEQIIDVRLIGAAPSSQAL